MTNVKRIELAAQAYQAAIDTHINAKASGDDAAIDSTDRERWAAYRAFHQLLKQYLNATL